MAVLCDVIHPLRPYLHLDIGVFLVLDRNVQGLVTVRLRIGKPVSESLRIRFILFGHE